MLTGDWRSIDDALNGRCRDEKNKKFPNQKLISICMHPELRFCSVKARRERESLHESGPLMNSDTSDIWNAILTIQLLEVTVTME